MSDTPPPVPPVPAVPPVVPASAVPPPPPGAPQPYVQAPPGQAPYGLPVAAAYAPQYGYARRTNTLAIVAFVLSLVAIFVWFLGSIAAVICGHIAMSQIKRTGEGGRGLALAAVIIGYSGLALGILVVVIYVLIIAAAVSSGSYSSVG